MCTKYLIVMIIDILLSFLGDYEIYQRNASYFINALFSVSEWMSVGVCVCGFGWASLLFNKYFAYENKNRLLPMQFNVIQHFANGLFAAHKRSYRRVWVWLTEYFVLSEKVLNVLLQHYDNFIMLLFITFSMNINVDKSNNINMKVEAKRLYRNSIDDFTKKFIFKWIEEEKKRRSTKNKSKDSLLHYCIIALLHYCKLNVVYGRIDWIATSLLGLSNEMKTTIYLIWR